MSEIIASPSGLYLAISDDGAELFARFVDALRFADYAAWARCYGGMP